LLTRAGLCAENSPSGKSVSSPDPKNISLPRLVETALWIPTIPPRVRDDRDTPPLWGGTVGIHKAVSTKPGSEIFLASGLDTDLPGGLFCEGDADDPDDGGRMRTS